MQLARSLPATDWRLIGLLLLAVPSVILSVVHIALLFLGQTAPFDWWSFNEAASRVFDGTLYQWGERPPGGEAYSYRYSPVFAAFMVPFTAIGIEVWRLLHISALALLPWRVALVTLLFAPFWFDVLHGNVLTFAFVLGFLALQGSRWATLGYFALLVMVPRPLMLPVAAWIVWQRPEWRLPAVGFALVGLAQLAYPGFVGALIRSAGADVHGSLWTMPLVIGIPLAALLTWRGRLGLASMAISPYVLPYYLVMLLLELRPSRPRSTRTSRAARWCYRGW